MDYSKMSDFEINKRVADIAMNGTWHVKPSHPDNNTGGWLYGSNGIQTYDLPDYCNAPADAWPIIADKKICLAFDVFAEPQDGGGWVASPAYGWETERVRHDNPLRAAMILFLKMQESANVPANPAGPDLR